MTKKPKWITRDGLHMRVGGYTWRWFRKNRAAINGKTPNPATTHTIKTTLPTNRPGSGLTGKRALLHKLMVATVGNPYAWTYAAVRPLPLPHRLPATAFHSRTSLKAALTTVVNHYRSDCSWGVKTLHRLAGCTDDPSGCNWNSYGNSSSTYQHLPKRPGLNNAYSPKPDDLARCQVGDILLVGENGSEHETTIMEAGPDPLLWSDGHEGAPNSYHVSDDPRRPITVCIPRF